MCIAVWFKFICFGGVYCFCFKPFKYQMLGVGNGRFASARMSKVVNTTILSCFVDLHVATSYPQGKNWRGSSVDRSPT